MSKDLVEYMASALVDHPEEVEVREIEDERGSVMELSVADGDLGMVIGKHGKTAKAMRAVLSAASTKAGKQTLLKIVE